MNAAHICELCNTPIFDGEARYGAVECQHYDCAFPNGRMSLSEAMAATDAAMFALTGKKPRKPSCRPGDGPIAQRLAKKLAALYLAEKGIHLDPKQFKFWVQDVAHRGPRWDLAVWGAEVPNPEYPTLNISFHSWGTMTQLVKAKSISMPPDGMPYTFDVG